MSDYTILEAKETRALEKSVIGHVEHGYEMHGYPFVRGKLVCQAMVRDEQTDHELAIDELVAALGHSIRCHESPDEIAVEALGAMIDVFNNYYVEVS